jgi:hypothetical protein
VRGLAAPLTLVLARARRRPRRWLLPSLGLALATAFAGAVAAEGVLAGDQAARTVLRGLSPLQRTVRVTWQRISSPAVERRARSLLDELGLPRQTQTTLLDPVRLDGVLVQPAAIEPLGRWLVGRGPPGPCRARACPMLAAGGSLAGRSLQAAGVRLKIVAEADLSSAAPLGFSPGAYGGPPVLLSGDVGGLDAVAGLSGVYRTHSRLAQLPVSRLSSWDLASIEQRLQRTQASLVQGASQGRGRGRPGCGRCCSRRSSRRVPMRFPRSSRAASAIASRCAQPSRMVRSCCSPMSRRRNSISPPRRRSVT